MTGRSTAPADGVTLLCLEGPHMSWNKPEMVEIKMDAEISSYQDDDYDPMKDGPHFVKPEARKPSETEIEPVLVRA